MRRMTSLVVVIAAIVALAALVPATAAAKPVNSGPPAHHRVDAAGSAGPGWPAVAFAIGFPVVVVGGSALLARRWSRHGAAPVALRPRASVMGSGSRAA